MPIYRQGAAWYARLARPERDYVWGGYPTRRLASLALARVTAAFAREDLTRDPTHARSPDSWRQPRLLENA